MKRQQPNSPVFYVALLLILSLGTSCNRNGDEAASRPTPSAPPSASGILETDLGVIFTADQISASEHWPNNDHPWTPSEADVMALEEQLAGYLPDEHPDLWQKLESYTRQYWGTVTPDGNRAIYANFFCDADRLDRWRTDFVMVLDGGDCYFQTIYDVENGDFVWLAINGES
jgi:hypothetical protein